MSNKSITQERLKKYFHYDKNTGLFKRLIAVSQTQAGDIASCIGSHGYIKINILNNAYLAHRLAFLYMTGSIPECQVDHINHVRTDNRWENLRLATNASNGRNQSKPISNKSGFTGVRFRKDIGKWAARIMVNRRDISLGCFEYISDAITARKQAEIKYGFHENHGS